MDKSIGILYICTGEYIKFWDQFYESFERFFLPNYTKQYFVFTDADDSSVFEGKDSTRISAIKIANLPWPLITLLRFEFFLSIKDTLMNCDYLLFCNSNLACNETVFPDDILPDSASGKSLSLVQHPGYWQKPSSRAPFERNPRSLAYVPYSYTYPYVIGAFICGSSNAFLSMANTLNNRIKADLKNNVIARWHDESHLNRFVAEHDDIRYLSPAYCYPSNATIDTKKVIYSVDKAKVINISSIKGGSVEEGLFNRFKKWFSINRPISVPLDMISHKKVDRI